MTDKDKDFSDGMKLYNLIEIYLKKNLESNLKIKEFSKGFRQIWNDCFKECKSHYLKNLKAKIEAKRK